MQRITGMNHCFQTLNATDFLFSSLSMFFVFVLLLLDFISSTHLTHVDL